MLLDCPTCARSYHVGRTEIGDAGRTVICPRCEASWFVDADGTSTLTPSHSDLHIASVSGRPRFSDEVDAKIASGPSHWRRMMPALATAACLILAATSIGARERIVRLLPRTAALYAGLGLQVNVRGLDIAVQISERAAEAPADVTIGGEIRNVAPRRVIVPRLVYEVRDAAGAPLVTWTERPGARTLAVGKTLPFVSAPRRLPADAKTVLVRFADEDAAMPVRVAHRTLN